jgi:hypothetical protein
MRVVLAGLLAAGLAALVLFPQPTSFLIALLTMLLGFLLAGAKAAVDLIELNPADIAADALALAAIGTALTRVSTANAMLVGSLLALACAAQAVPLAARMARCPRRSTSPRMPPGSA